MSVDFAIAEGREGSGCEGRLLVQRGDVGPTKVNSTASEEQTRVNMADFGDKRSKWVIDEFLHCSQDNYNNG